MRSKNVTVQGETVAVQKKADKELSTYADIRKQGVQPKSTRMSDIRAADIISNETGTAYQA